MYPYFADKPKKKHTQKISYLLPQSISLSVPLNPNKTHHSVNKITNVLTVILVVANVSTPDGHH